MRSCDKEKGRKYVALVAQVCEYCTVVIIPSSLCPIPYQHPSQTWSCFNAWCCSATLSVSTPFSATSYLQQILHHSQPPPTSSRSYTIPSHLLPPADPTPFPATSYLQQILHHSQPPPTSSRSYTIPSHLLPPADPTPFPATSYLQQIHPRLIPPRHWERGAAAC
ncbi:hypothetical protein Pmani_015674 [Petrolisthes manimaculis]|uniref:Uncharacterized protein n=1 Tax=Petrolisthes manimaculis TaxID=1843537 RepID=A0AAE1UBU6_9EUCA|nr:hypothetical protein Pmani_015674 [Petrolisthes manimaculis]